MNTIVDNDKHLRQRFLSGALVEQLQQFGVLDHDQAEALGLALADIAEEIAVIYRDIVPRLERATTPEAFQDALVDLIDAFRHVDYHIHDATRLEP
jgi:hypothetical protein